MIVVVSGVVALAIIAMVVWVLVRGARSSSQVHCPANQWTVVVDNFGTGYAKTFNLYLHAEGGQPVQGMFRETRWLWIIKEAPLRGPLMPQMQFHRRWINAMYRVEICPTVPTTVQLS